MQAGYRAAEQIDVASGQLARSRIIRGGRGQGHGKVAEIRGCRNLGKTNYATQNTWNRISQQRDIKSIAIHAVQSHVNFIFAIYDTFQNEPYLHSTGSMANVFL